MAKKKISQKQLDEAVSIASRYTPGEGAVQKDSLKTKAKMAILGKNYKTDTAKRMIARRKQGDSNMTARTKSAIEDLKKSGMTNEEIKRLRGKK